MESADVWYLPTRLLSETNEQGFASKWVELELSQGQSQAQDHFGSLSGVWSPNNGL